MPRMLRAVVSLTFAILVLTAPFQIASADEAGQQILWQTNADGDDIHLFDVATGELKDRLEVGPNPHGIAATKTTVFVTLENNGGAVGELLWIDRKSREIQHRLEVGPEPHALAVSRNGKWAYVPCRDGHYWVIDLKQKAVAARIETGGRPHNTTAHPTDNRIYLSPMGSPKRVTIIDPTRKHKILGFMAFSDSVRPPALAPTRGLFFQHVDGLNGFEVADLETNALLARVEHSSNLGVPIWPASLGFADFSGLNRCHGLAVRPGDQEIWSICGRYATIHTIGDADFPESGHIKLPSKGYWLTHSRDGKHVFIALSEAGQVAQVDAESRQIIRFLDAGNAPKRNLVLKAD